MTREGKTARLFEKRSESLCYSGRALPQRAPENAQVSWFFFSKKNVLPSA
jgi:hypothetical protein